MDRNRTRFFCDPTLLKPKKKKNKKERKNPFTLGSKKNQKIQSNQVIKIDSINIKRQTGPTLARRRTRHKIEPKKNGKRNSSSFFWLFIILTFFFRFLLLVGKFFICDYDPGDRFRQKKKEKKRKRKRKRKRK